jgi:hypothetical protein
MTLRPNPKRRWPKRLVGDTPSLRGRFRALYPDVRISIEPGSAYRAWVNAQRPMLNRVGRRRRSREVHPFPGDNPLLRRNFELNQGVPFYELERPYAVPHFRARVDALYHEWLRSKGIDPETGKMTVAGLAFFRTLVEDENAQNHTKQDRGRRAA